MSRFENKLCPVCRSRFNDKADVVVCPVCGTPHHRTCYNINGACALEELHDKGWNWEGKLPDEVNETKPQLVGADVGAQFDEHHAEYPGGTPRVTSDTAFERERRMFEERFGDDDPFGEIFENFSDKEIGEDGVSMHELITYASTSIYHYGSAFRRFRGSADGKKRFTSFNFSSGIFAPVFQFYRRMNFIGVITLILVLVPSVIYVMLPEQVIQDNGMRILYLLEFAALIFKVLLCVFGDYIYYRHCIRSIVRFRKNYDGDTKSDEYFMSLFESGRPTFAGGALGCLALAFAQACIMAFAGTI